MPEISERQIAVIQGALLSSQEAIETLVSDEELVPELVRGIIMGVFLGVPQQLKKALAALEEVGLELDESDQPDRPGREE